MNKTKKNYNNFDMTLEECKLVFDTIDGLVVVDENGKIKYISEVLLDFCNSFERLDMTEVTGKSINDIHPASKIQNVLTSGKEEEECFYFVGGEVNIARIKPLFKNGELKGAIDYDLFRYEKDFRRFFDKVVELSLNGFINLSMNMKDLMKKYDESRKYKYTVGDIIGESHEIKLLRKNIYDMAESDTTVLITGETGCGKELVAHSIHSLSRRGTSNLVKINCAAIPESLVESELFGYEEGSFTGASKGGKRGKFELANGGTIFFDEIDQLPFHAQPKLLRALQEKEIDRIGSSDTIPIDVRVIAATNKNLKLLVAEGKFREDLYYRLNVIELRIPPLRERKEDISILVNTYISKLNHTIGRNVSGISFEALEMLRNYDWPGNIRELFNIIERAMNKCRGTELDVQHFENFFVDISKQKIGTLSGSLDGPLQRIRDLAEREAVLSALNLCKGNKSRAAQLLRISRPSLYEKMKKLNISEVVEHSGVKRFA